MTERTFDLSSPEEQSRQAMEGAIERARELGWMLFIAVRYRGSAEFNCFTVFMDPRLAEFMTACAHYAFLAEHPGAIWRSSAPVDAGDIDDSEMRLALENAFICATFSADVYFSGLIMPILEDPVR